VVVALLHVLDRLHGQLQPRLGVLLQWGSRAGRVS
jgi:hypothetical protein